MCEILGLSRSAERVYRRGIASGRPPVADPDRRLAMDLQHLRYFVAVADQLHFTRAARRLYVDQGALSGAIRRLEKELGVRLFDRDSHRVELTPAGAALYPEALSLLAGAERLVATAAAHRSAPVTTLRIGLFLG